jgi:adenosylmethionine-8-amino-7-oxononanoate aminotransferase
MEMKNMSWDARSTERLFPTFTDLPALAQDGAMVIERGEGPYVIDTAGNRYLECNSGLWNMTLGFSEARLVEAAKRQYDSLPGYHTFFGRSSKPTVELAERILDLAPVPMSRAFFTNSGSEANESVVKLLWLMWRGQGEPKRRKFITRRNAYHGATVMASSLTGKDYVQAFGLPQPEVVTVGCPHAWRFAQPGEDDDSFAARLARELHETIQAEGPDTIAGFFAEPVMGAGGVLIPPATYFGHIQKVLKAYDIPLICDEVICGFGRTGNLWGAETVGCHPDILVASKSLSAGYFPMGAVLLSKDIDDRLTEACKAWDEFPHGFTAGGHPVGCAVSLEAIRIIVEEGVIEHVQKITPLFLSQLNALGHHPLVGEARGVGLMGALEIVSDKASKAPFASEFRIGEQIAQRARQRGLIVRPLGSSIVLAPPFVVSHGQVEEMFSIMREVIDGVATYVTT